MTGGIVRLTWEPVEPATSLRADVDRALAAGARRVELLADPADADVLRAAARAGLRREGLLRALEGPSPEGDRVLCARVATDPEPDTREGFSAVLDRAMPTKRVVAQGLLRDREGRVLVCETTYKRDWDLPGGIVDPDESPAHTVAREVREELGIELTVGRLLATSWMPRYFGWSDAFQVVYDLGFVDADITATMALHAGEIRAVHWVDEADRCAGYEQRVIDAARAVGPHDPPAELSDGHAR